MIRAFWRDTRGNMAILFATAFAVSGIIGALAVNAASLYQERRLLQAAVDLAAITAARSPREADTIVRDVLAQAGFNEFAGLSVAVGRYEADATRPPADRFMPGKEPANAVSVYYEQQGMLMFADRLSVAPTLGAHGLATVMPEVSFSVGSRLASLNGGIANALMSALLGTSVSLSVVDYKSLATAHINALSFLDAVAQELDLDVGSYDELLKVKANAGIVAKALASLTTGADRAALTKLALAGKGNSVPLDKLFDLGRYGRLSLATAHAELDADLSVLEILSAAAALANGDRQVWLGLGGNLPGIAALTVELIIGEPAQGGGWFAIGPLDTIVRTAQVRLRVEAKFLGGLVLQSAVITLPLWLDMAPADAKILSATCPNRQQPNGTAEIAVLPGALDLAVGQVSTSQLRDFGAPLPLKATQILDALLLQMSAKAHVRVAQTAPIILNFSSLDIGEARLKTAKTTTPVTSLGQSLLDSLTLDIKVLGLGLAPLNVLAQTLKTTITPIASSLDTVINTLLTTLGLGVGEADVRVYRVRCVTPVLVG